MLGVCARVKLKSCYYTKHALQTVQRWIFVLVQQITRSASQSKLFMQRNLQEDFDEAKSKIGESVMLAGVEIKGLELQTLKSIVPGTSTKRQKLILQVEVPACWSKEDILAAYNLRCIY